MIISDLGENSSRTKIVMNPKTKKGKNGGRLMSAYFCPHFMFNFGYLIEFVCLKIDLIEISYIWVY